MKQRYVYALAILLTAVGLSVFAYKWRVLGFPVIENQVTPVWTIESAIRFDSRPGSIKVHLHIPTLTPGFRILNENSVSRGHEVTGLGYLGVDMVIDRERGPLILEMNARPGLNIQIANCTGLAKRIARVDEIHDDSAGPHERARAARREFPAERQTSIPFDD